MIVNELQADVLGCNGNGVALVVSDRVGHLEKLKELTEKTSIPSDRIALLTGETKSEKRKEIIERLNDGGISVVLSTISLISEGFDYSRFSSLHLATPISWKGRILQIVGRILRPEEGKQPVVVDYVDVCIGVLEFRAEQRLELLLTEAYGTEITHSPWGKIETQKESKVKKEKPPRKPNNALAIQPNASKGRQLALPGMQAAA
jgi:superfamily II DNA or RNA helicase